MHPGQVCADQRKGLMENCHMTNRSKDDSHCQVLLGGVLVMSSVVCLDLQRVCNERDILLETPVWQELETDHHLVDLISTE
ncbi:hypothetical protein R3I93_006358 [Phoxinus phoxinus]|uniref:Uncharacterized protein n=1 Tax=Phoxinus phoxinus TaxID=58324 RepID=A0AAN9HEB8_9TELE